MPGRLRTAKGVGSVARSGDSVGPQAEAGAPGQRSQTGIGVAGSRSRAPPAARRSGSPSAGRWSGISRENATVASLRPFRLTLTACRARITLNHVIGAVPHANPRESGAGLLQPYVEADVAGMDPIIRLVQDSSKDCPVARYRSCVIASSVLRQVDGRAIEQTIHSHAADTCVVPHLSGLGVRPTECPFTVAGSSRRKRTRFTCRLPIQRIRLPHVHFSSIMRADREKGRGTVSRARRICSAQLPFSSASHNSAQRRAYS